MSSQRFKDLLNFFENKSKNSFCKNEKEWDNSKYSENSFISESAEKSPKLQPIHVRKVVFDLEATESRQVTRNHFSLTTEEENESIEENLASTEENNTTIPSYSSKTFKQEYNKADEIALGVVDDGETEKPDKEDLQDHKSDDISHEVEADDKEKAIEEHSKEDSILKSVDEVEETVKTSTPPEADDKEKLIEDTEIYLTFDYSDEKKIDKQEDQQVDESKIEVLQKEDEKKTKRLFSTNSNIDVEVMAYSNQEIKTALKKKPINKLKNVYGDSKYQKYSLHKAKKYRSKSSIFKTISSNFFRFFTGKKVIELPELKITRYFDIISDYICSDSLEMEKLNSVSINSIRAIEKEINSKYFIVNMKYTREQFLYAVLSHVRNAGEIIPSQYYKHIVQVSRNNEKDIGYKKIKEMAKLLCTGLGEQRYNLLIQIFKLFLKIEEKAVNTEDKEKITFLSLLKRFSPIFFGPVNLDNPRIVNWQELILQALIIDSNNIKAESDFSETVDEWNKDCVNGRTKPLLSKLACGCI